MGPAAARRGQSEAGGREGPLALLTRSRGAAAAGPQLYPAILEQIGGTPHMTHVLPTTISEERRRGDTISVKTPLSSPQPWRGVAGPAGCCCNQLILSPHPSFWPAQSWLSPAHHQPQPEIMHFCCLPRPQTSNKSAIIRSCHRESGKTGQ